MSLAINLPEIIAEVEAVFARYGEALIGNNVEVLDELFWSSEWAVRYGAAENLYGFAAIAAFRSQRDTLGLARCLIRNVVTTFGSDFATVNTEFRLEGSGRIGRQSQTWLRTEVGWRVVAAHISFIGPE